MCIFCSINPKDIITDNELAFTIFDRFPVSEGHVLIIPKRHVQTYFDLTEQELLAMHKLSLTIKKILEEQFRPDGYNIGFNVNEAGGQTIFHCHMHVIPRYKGDVGNPRGGIRGVIPDKQKY